METRDNSYEPKPLYIILSVLELLCCNQIAGILGIVFFLIADNSYKSCDYESCLRYLKYCKIALVTGLIISLLFSIFVALYLVAGLLLLTY